MQLLNRGDVLENLNQLIAKQVELEEQILTYKTYIKNLQEEHKQFTQEIRGLHKKLESNQLTFGRAKIES